MNYISSCVSIFTYSTSIFRKQRFISSTNSSYYEIQRYAKRISNFENINVTCQFKRRYHTRLILCVNYTEHRNMYRMYDKQDRSFFTSFYHSKEYQDNKTEPLRVIINVTLKSYSVVTTHCQNILCECIIRKEQAKQKGRKKKAIGYNVKHLLTEMQENSSLSESFVEYDWPRVNNWRTERNETRLEE